jgi:hypothetical protein
VSQRSAAQSSRDTWSRQRLAGGTGQCPVCQLPPKDQRSDALEKERDHAPDNYSDCPVHHPTKGKFGLPCWPPTAPSYLGAIKGIPRRMEELSKHSLSILRLQLHAFDSL